MRLILIVIYIFCISVTGLSAYSAISDDLFYNDGNSMHGWDNSELFNNDYRNAPQKTFDHHSVIANSYLFDDCLLKTQQASALLTYDKSEMKCSNNFNYKWTNRAGRVYYAMNTKAELSIIHINKDRKLSNNPSQSNNNNYAQVVFWIKDVYHALVAENQNDSNRLLLLSFGLVGIIGIRRNVKKS